MEFLLVMGTLSIVVWTGFFSYNKLIESYRGIIGPLKAWGITLIIPCVGSIIAGIVGSKSNNAVEIVLSIAFIILAVFLYINALGKCPTKGKKIGLFFAAVLIAFGFAFRIVFKFIFNLPMASSSASSDDGFPNHIRQNGDFYDKVTDYGTSALYECKSTGHTFTINRGELALVHNENKADDID